MISIRDSVNKTKVTIFKETKINKTDGQVAYKNIYMITKKQNIVSKSKLKLDINELLNSLYKEYLISIHVPTSSNLFKSDVRLTVE